MGQFSFDKALGWAFTAPHARSYFIFYPLVYGLAYLILFGAIGALGYSLWPQIAASFEALDASGDDPAAAISAMTALGAQTAPLIGLFSIGSWIVWAMFEAASQRRFVRGDRFSLGLGMDELRLMWVSLLFGLMGLVIFAIPLIIMGNGFLSLIASSNGALSEDEIAARVLPSIFGGLSAMVLFFFVYTFFATRLAPCFGLTIKERKARFLDAWNVSRGRFWPILGAFLILAIAGSIVTQIVQSMAQFALIPALATLDTTSEVPDFSTFTSPGFLISAAVAGFIIIAIQGLYLHVIAAPAAFAARQDPRGGVETQEQIAAFG
jgi:hypothetical protein